LTLSDQTEESTGALPKGYEPNAQGEPQDQDKKIWDKYYNGEIELPDVVKELKHYRNSKDTELETSDEDQREKDLKEYEQKYLSRYKQPKANLRKPMNLKSDDLGRLNLRKHTIAKRSEYLAKRKDYEEKYILRYMKKRKAEPKRSSSKNLDHDLISGRLNLRAFVDKKRHEIKTERTEYEKKNISKYKESKASIKKSKSLTESDDLGKFTISTKTTALKKLRAERAEYDKQYLVPRFTTIHCAVYPTLFLWSVGMSQSRYIDYILIVRMSYNAGDACSFFQPHFGPGITTIGRFINSVTNGMGRTYKKGLAGTSPDNFWIFLINSQSTNGRYILIIKNRLP